MGDHPGDQKWFIKRRRFYAPLVMTFHNEGIATERMGAYFINKILEAFLAMTYRRGIVLPERHCEEAI